jgi:succinate dehydrogenase / fumarate reductase iron-sulfur subunit
MLQRRKATPGKILLAHKIPDNKKLHRIFDTIEGRDERIELNLYITQPDDEVPDTKSEGETETSGTPGSSSPERSPNT